MEQIFSKLNFITNGEGFTDITNDLNLFIQKSNFDSGIFCLTSLHTSCSLTINENADPNVLKDLEKFIKSIVPYNCYTSLSKEREEIYYEHFQEGEDDMPAHIKTAVLVNEFGEIGIDNELIIKTADDMIELNNGCICCTINGELLSTVSKILDRPEKIDYLIVETTGLADPLL